jgi:hypothetical protein
LPFGFYTGSRHLQPRINIMIHMDRVLGDDPELYCSPSCTMKWANIFPATKYDCSSKVVHKWEKIIRHTWKLLPKSFGIFCK